MRLHSFLACIAVLIPVFACGGVTLSGPEPDDDGGTGSGTGSGADSGLATASVSLAVPLGLYTGCQVTTLSVGTQPGDAGGGFSAANGGPGPSRWLRALTGSSRAPSPSSRCRTET